MLLTDKVGILDPDGKNLNPLNKEPYTFMYKFYSRGENKDGWSYLPMYNDKNYPPLKMMRLIKNHQVTILEAGTGQGKTVIVPKYCLHIVGYEGNIVATNPKKIPTKENAMYSSLCSDVALTKEIGYKYKGSADENEGKKTSSNETKLLYATDGTLSEILRKDPTCSSYDIVIIDEAHERNLRIDNILLQMKTALRLNPDLKLVIMSATLPGNLFINYYKEFSLASINLPAIPNKPVKVHYQEKDINKKQIDEKSIDLLFDKIIKKSKNDDAVLIFTTSQSSANKMCDEINRRTKNYKDGKPYCVVMTGKVKDTVVKKSATEENTYKKQPGGPWNRKIVIGTNALESSITIKGLGYVIDNGYALFERWDPRRMMRSLETGKISKDAMAQRKGRVGRTKPGECFKMYTKNDEEKREDYTDVDIKKSDLTEEFLLKFNIDGIKTVGDVKKVFKSYIENPSNDFIWNCVRTLFQLRILNNFTDRGVLTPLGKVTLKILNRTSGISVSSAVSIVFSLALDCHYDVCAIVSIMSMEQSSLFFSEDTPKFKNIEKKLTDKSSDVFTSLNVYRYFLNFTEISGEYNEKKLRNFCKENFLNFNLLLNIRTNHIDLVKKTYLKNIEKINSLDSHNNIIFSLLFGYNISIAQRKEEKYKNWFPEVKTKASLSRNSVLNFSKKSDFIIYGGILSLNGKVSFENCTQISKNVLKKFNKLSKYNIPVV